MCRWVAKNHMDAHGTRFLGNTGNWSLHFFARCHDEVGKLVDHDHDVGQIPVALSGVEAHIDKFVVVFAYRPHIGF